MEMWLTYKSERLRLPITPTFSISFSNNHSTEVLNEVGSIQLSGKPGLRSCTLSSFFPADESLVESSDAITDPYYYVRKIFEWARTGEPIRFIITETPYNFEVLIQSFEPGEPDGSSNVSYSLELVEYVRVETTQYTPPKNQLPKVQDIPRFAAAATIPLALVTVGKYDTAWSMAKALTGSGELAKPLLEKNGLTKLVIGKVLHL